LVGDEFDCIALVAINDSAGKRVAEIDIMEANDKAAALFVLHGEETWLARWGEWLVEQAGIDPLESCQLHAMWEQVHTVAEEFKRECKKKAKTIACSLCSSEEVQRIFRTSRN
ncbi:MAG: hypothetical protein ACIALR_01415, partial [Blastopirellula sp. JB062]